ncbi:MAG: hypothetical protein LCH88_05375 [Proteobacteria bacterium]|nr:hypothetical protein [Pseudomonadota bacterium]
MAGQNDHRAGALTADKIVLAAFLRGRGKTHGQICKELDVRNEAALITVLKAHGVPDHVVPAGMREVRAHVSNARHADIAAMVRQAGYELEAGVGEFLAITAKDRSIRATLTRAKR